MPVTERMIEKANKVGRNVKRTAQAMYDFSANGGAIGTHKLGVDLPDNAIITRAWYEVLTTFTSATDSATIALTSGETAGDLKAAVAISDVSNPYDAGMHECIQDGTAANFKKLTANRVVAVVIAVDALTAGKLILNVEYAVTI